MMLDWEKPRNLILPHFRQHEKINSNCEAKLMLCALTKGGPGKIEDRRARFGLVSLTRHLYEKLKTKKKVGGYLLESEIC